MIALIAILLVLVVVGVVMWKRRKDSKDKRQREWLEKMSHQMGTDANSTLRDGNTLLRQVPWR